jgi:hypothetical protein
MSDEMPYRKQPPGNTRHGRFTGVNTGHIGRIVKRGKIGADADRRFYGGCDDYGMREFLAAVNDAVSDSIDFGKIRDHTVILAGQDFQNFSDCRFVIGQINLKVTLPLFPWHVR